MKPDRSKSGEGMRKGGGGGKCRFITFESFKFDSLVNLRVNIVF